MLSSSRKLSQIAASSRRLLVGGCRSFSTTKPTLTSSSTTTSIEDSDRLIVIGSGVAGCGAALVAAELYKIPTTLVFAGPSPTDCNSYWAQGGIIYRGQEGEDSPDLLAQDIHRAGAGICHDPAVRKVAWEGPERVQQLLLDRDGPFANVPFQRNDAGELSLCLEASHTAPRILYKADHTGRVITEHITAAAAQHPLITMQENTIVTDLMVKNGVCVGIETLEGRRELASRGVVLASGGLAGIYQHSTNPPGFNALGSSVALAQRAHAATQDLEYVQFHPTALLIPNEARFLLTEALRGEGAKLRNHTGEAFATNFHPSGELAPRDIVARGVFDEAQRTGHAVTLDITHRDADWLHGRFPTIQQYVSQRGLDLATDWLPITPAAHYTCGGVQTDLQGRTSLPGLYAAGEAARTGLHGGNRLASTSLLEGLVFGATVADFVGSGEGRVLGEEAQSIIRGSQQQQVPQQQPSQQTTSAVAVEEAHHLLTELKTVMWDHVGVVRTPSGLSHALDELEVIQDKAEALFDQTKCAQTAGLRDAAVAGQAVAEAALANPTARGAHFVVDDEEEEEMEVMAAAP